MLDRPSFEKFKNTLIAFLEPHNFDTVRQTLHALEAVNFVSSNPKSSYKALYDILNQAPRVAVSRYAILSKAATKANQAIAEATKSALAYNMTVMIKQDCTQRDIPFNLAPTITFQNLNTQESTVVTTQFRF